MSRLEKKCFFLQLLQVLVHNFGHEAMQCLLEKCTKIAIRKKLQNAGKVIDDSNLHFTFQFFRKKKITNYSVSTLKYSQTCLQRPLGPQIVIYRWLLFRSGQV